MIWLFFQNLTGKSLQDQIAFVEKHRSEQRQTDYIANRQQQHEQVVAGEGGRGFDKQRSQRDAYYREILGDDARIRIGVENGSQPLRI
jgi:hypothetical protein